VSQLEHVAGWGTLAEVLYGHGSTLSESKLYNFCCCFVGIGSRCRSHIWLASGLLGARSVPQHWISRSLQSNYYSVHSSLVVVCLLLLFVWFVCLLLL
jgi:hypothetical protein